MPGLLGFERRDLAHEPSHAARDEVREGPVLHHDRRALELVRPA
jgi:hypothetical protein